ncbi:MAG: TonB-dependent receptor, partial [Saprospiraceae bacterium]
LSNLLYSQPAAQEPKSTYMHNETVVDTTGDDLLLNNGTQGLNEIVVSANRFEQQRKDVPQQTEIITASSMAFDNMQTSGDVIQNTGNILVQKSQLGGGSPVIRGFETNKVLLVVDGVRMNNAIYRAGHLQNIVTLDNAVMDRVEILYGPGSVMYGSDALGGVMHFFTKNPTFSSDGTTAIHGSAFARYSTADAEKTGHVDLSIGGGKLASLTSFTYSDFDDLVQGSQRKDKYPDFGKRTFYVERQGNADVAIANDDVDKQIGSGYSQYDILQKFVYNASDAVSHTLNLQYSNSSDVPRYDRLTQGTLQSPTYAEWYYGPQKRLMAAYRLGMNKGIGLLGKGGVTLAYQSIEESRNDRRFNSVNFNHRIEKLSILTLNADFTHQTGASTWSYGLEGTYNKVNSTAHRDKIDTGVEVPLDTRYPNGGSTVSSAALYLNDSYAVNDHFHLQAGVRAAYHTLNSKFDDKTFFPFPFDEVSQSSLVATGSLGFVWNSDGGSRVNFIASSGFRAPSVDDMSKVFESVPGSVIVPNPDLGPEHTYNVDLGLSQNINDRLEIGVEGFYTWYRNAITTAPGTFNGQTQVVYNDSLSDVTTNVNAKKAFVYGANAYVSLDITNSLSLYSTINYTYGRIERESDEVPLDHVAPLFGKTSLRWSKDKLKAEFYVMYNAAKKLEDYNPDGEDNLPYATPDGMPAWMTFNVKGSYQLTKNFTIQLGVENIADQNYRIFASNISAPGRNVVVTVRAKW